MPKRISKRKEEDVNLIAKSILDKATFEKATLEGKNPAAVALGRLGGLKGGKARAEKLSSSRRSQIASMAAQVRWYKKRKTKRKK